MVVVLVGVLVTLNDFSIPHRLNKLLLLVFSLGFDPADVMPVVAWFKSNRLAEFEASLRNLSNDFLSTTTAEGDGDGDFPAGLGSKLHGPLLRLRVGPVARGLMSMVLDFGRSWPTWG